MVTETSSSSKFWDETKLLEMDNQVGFFRDYLQVMENFLEAEAQKYHEHRARLRQERYGRLKQEGRQFDPTEPPSLEEDWANHQEQMIDTIFASILRKSLFISLYAFLESRMVEECRYRGRWGKTALPLADVIGGGIEEAKKCLKGQVDFSGSEWGEIKKLQRLRNFIVHCGDSFENVKSEHHEKPLKQYVAEEQALSLKGDGIVFHKGFCEKALDAIERFLELL
jgi:hypothetical protein